MDLGWPPSWTGACGLCCVEKMGAVWRTGSHRGPGEGCPHPSSGLSLGLVPPASEDGRSALRDGSPEAQVSLNSSFVT